MYVMRYALCDKNGVYLNVQESIHMYVCVYNLQIAARPKNCIRTYGLTLEHLNRHICRITHNA